MEYIVVTGALGFIGRNFVEFLNNKGFDNIILIDTLKQRNFLNLYDLKFKDFVDYTEGLDYLFNYVKNFKISAIFHIGANSDVLVSNCKIMLEENFKHSKLWFFVAKEKNAPMIYASSSAIYGNSGCFKVDPSCEKPHNEYAFSKWLFDNYVKANIHNVNNKVIGFRLFNVFGWGEFHKGKNASLPYRFFEFVIKKGFIDLFNADIKRDYIWVGDVCEVFYKTWLENPLPSGIYNLGSGNPISHKRVAELVIETMIEEKVISENREYITPIPMPEELKHRFQYYTQAEDVPEWIKDIVNNTEGKMKGYIKKLCKNHRRGGE